ncbi:alpha/beta hydrolase [Streptomyces sp. NPDC050610]|uniref:alpha/beta hydrolase n=1 Tax=Streptomyces sp. NPDC050610 TaxID=3157097 RepID=UPI00342E266D
MAAGPGAGDEAGPGAGAAGDAGSAAVAEEAALLALDPVPPDRTVRYGAHASQVIDFYEASGDGPAVAAAADIGTAAGTGTSTDIGTPTAAHTLVTLLHGGFWRQAYDRAHLSPLAAALARHGVTVALAEYRRVGGGGGWPGTFDDVVRAVEAGAAHCADRSADRSRGVRHVVAGHSAGGHLALWAASRHRLPAGSRWREADAHAPRIDRVVALSPVADLAYARELRLSDDAVAELLQGAEARSAEADPARLLPPRAPVVVLHGTADPDVPADVSRRYAAEAAAAGGDIVLHELPGTGHYAPVTPGTDAFALFLAALRDAGA